MPEWVELWRETSQRAWLPATRGSKKDSDRVIIPAAEAVRVSAHLVLPGSPWPKQLCHLHAQPSLKQSCHRPKKKKKSYVYAHRGCFSHIQFFENLWTALLEHYISYCPSCQLLWVPGAARTPVTHAAAPPPHLVLTGENPSPPGQP